MCVFALVCRVFLFVALFAAFTFAQYEDDEPECQCVPQNRCLDNDGGSQGLFDIRYETKQCPSYFDVCCENIAPDISTPQNSPNLLTPHQPPNAFKGCGRQPPITSRIMGDLLTAQFAELPWSLALLKREPDLGAMKYKCGASLIHPQVAMTVAHCTTGSKAQELAVRAGEWNTKTRSEPLPHQDMKVKEVVVHPRFHPGSLWYDIALLFLTEPVTLADNVGTVCVPAMKMVLESNCIASGWGKDAFKTGRYSSILKKVELPLVPRPACVKSLRTTRLGKFFNLHKSFICAGGEASKDTCEGDGGSPLVCGVPGQEHRYAQVGMVAWGMGCGESDIPGVYVNVAMFRGWIDKQMASKGLDNLYYNYE